MKVYIEPNEIYHPEVKYIFNLFSFNKGLEFTYVSSLQDADLVISEKSSADIRISIQFYRNLNEEKFLFSNFFKDKCEYVDPEGFTDLLSTAYYMVNCLQEAGDRDDDNFGRFKYENSYQKKFGNVRINLVQNLFDRLWNSINKFRGLRQKSTRSEIYLSHDIDTIHGSIVQDSFYAVKKLRPDILATVLLENAINRPSWFNIDRIMKIENEYDFTSMFYWLVNKGKTTFGLNNSDYDISSGRVRKKILAIDKSNWENGLHKSASNETFNREVSKLPCKVTSNRYHYIKFKPHEHFPEVEASGLKSDASLGFADAPGFRNSFGMPFSPFNIKTRKPYSFIEIPLNIMDTTYFNYLKVDSERFISDVKNFTESNSNNAIISVLFHNNFISKFKYGKYFEAFKRLLSFFYESDFKSINQKEIIQRYGNGH